MKIKKLVKLAPMMLLTFLLGLSGCSGSTSADARVNDHCSFSRKMQNVFASFAKTYFKNRKRTF